MMARLVCVGFLFPVAVRMLRRVYRLTILISIFQRDVYASFRVDEGGRMFQELIDLISFQG